MIRSVRLSLAVAVAFATPVFTFGQVNPPTVVVKTGDAAPGAGAGVTYGPSGAPAFVMLGVSSAGQVMYYGSLTGTGVTATNNLGLWAATPGGTPTLIARIGDPAPDTGGVPFSAIPAAGGNVQDLSFGPTGLATYLGSLTIGGSVTSLNNVGIWTGLPGSSSLLIRTGDAAPGVAGATVASMLRNSTASNGTVTFTGTAAGGGITTANDGAAWAGSTPANLRLIAREGDVAPGAGGATIGGTAGITMGGTNANGATAFRFNVTGTGVTAANNAGIWTDSGTGPALVSRLGDAAPGVTSGVFAAYAATPSVLANGNTVIGATMTVNGTTVTSSNDAGVWMGSSPGTLALAYRKGDAIPNASGLTAGPSGSGALGINSINGNHWVGRMSVAGAGVNGTNDTIIFSYSVGVGLSMVVREGDVAPGTGGAGFTAFGLSSSTLGGGILPNIGADGTVAFRTTLAGSGVTTANDAGIWVRYGTAGTVRLVARKGDAINVGTVAVPDNQVITDLSILDGQFTSGSAGFSPTDATGQLGWIAQLADGRTVVLFTPVPEPSSLLALSALGLYAVARSGGSRKKSTKTTSAAA